jgi:hypothetical protein
VISWLNIIAPTEPVPQAEKMFRNSRKLMPRQNGFSFDCSTGVPDNHAVLSVWSPREQSSKG